MGNKKLQHIPGFCNIFLFDLHFETIRNARVEKIWANFYTINPDKKGLILWSMLQLPQWAFWCLGWVSYLSKIKGKLNIGMSFAKIYTVVWVRLFCNKDFSNHLHTRVTTLLMCVTWVHGYVNDLENPHFEIGLT